jgi:hypothetical protein
MKRKECLLLGLINVGWVVLTAFLHLSPSSLFWAFTVNLSVGTTLLLLFVEEN